MKLFGKTISLKRCGCSVNGAAMAKVPPEVNLYVRVTNDCTAHCSFCSNGSNTGKPITFDRTKLMAILDELENSGIAVNRLSVTGGEPGIARKVVEVLLDNLNSIAYQHIPVTLSTNGLAADSRALIRHPRWNEVCMSVHHYDYARMAESYGLTGNIERFDFSDLPTGRVSFTCNLIRGFIDSPVEMSKMIDFAHEHRVKELGFGELMKVNAFCQDHYVDIDGIDLSTIRHLIKDRESRRPGVCCCRNYLHFRNDDCLHVYVRALRNPLYCESSLL